MEELEDPFQYKISVLSNRASSPPSSLRHRGPYSTPYCTSRCQGQVVRKYIESIYFFYLIFKNLKIRICKSPTRKCTSGFPTAGTSPGNYQDEDGVLPVSLLQRPAKCPPNFQSTGFAPQRGTERLAGRRAKVLKSGFPKIASTQSLSKEKSSQRLQIF